MRYSASEKAEIIRLVWQSALPVKRILEKLGIPRATFYRWCDGEYLSVEEIKEAPTTQIAFDSSGQQQNHQQQQQEGGPQELDISRDSSRAFERVRAEMIKLGTLECVRPAARQK